MLCKDKRGSERSIRARDPLSTVVEERKASWRRQEIKMPNPVSYSRRSAVWMLGAAGWEEAWVEEDGVVMLQPCFLTRM